MSQCPGSISSGCPLVELNYSVIDVIHSLLAGQVKIKRIAHGVGAIAHKRNQTLKLKMVGQFIYFVRVQSGFVRRDALDVGVR